MNRQHIIHLTLIFLMLAVVFPLPAFAQDTPETHIHEIVNHLVEDVFNEGDMDAIDELFTDDFVSHTLSSNVHDSGREDFKKTVSFFRDAIPDLQASTDFVIVEDNTASFLLMLDGTFSHDIAEPGSGIVIRATHDPVHFTFMFIMNFDENGKITDDWILSDSVTYFTQFGMIDPAEFFRSVSGLR